MKIVWVGLVFHAVMILWLDRKGLPTNHKSKPCVSVDHPSRLLVALMPGLRTEHAKIFEDYKTGVVGNVKQTPEKSTPVISYFSGVATQNLFPNTLDTIFDHTSATVYSGREGFPFDKGFIKVRMPPYYHGKYRANERAEIDGLSGFMWSKNNSYRDVILAPANSTLFLLNLSGLKTTNTSMDSVRSLYFDIIQLVKSIDFLYGKPGTNVLILGDNGGPMALWGPEISRNRRFFRMGPPDVAPLIAALLGIAVPYQSVGVLSPSIFGSKTRRWARAVTCNAVQLDTLVKENIQGPFMADLRQMYNSSIVMGGVKWLRHLTQSHLRHDRPLERGSNVIRFLKTIYDEGSLRQDKIALALIVVGIVSWIFLLFVELASISYPHVRDLSWPFIVMHVMFSVLTLISGLLPFIGHWPYTYYVFTVLPVLLTWAACSRIDVLISLFIATPWKNMPIYILYFTPVLLLAEYSLRSSSFDMMALVIGICVVAQFPALPRFSVSPFLAKSGWFWCCCLLLGALYLPQWPARHPRLYNLCGTVLIVLSGFSAFWLKPARDRFLCVGLTLLTTVAMMIQPLSQAPQYEGQLKYVSFPLMLTPFLSLVGQAKTKNRLIHITFAFGVLIMLTSSRFEPLCYLLSIVTCFLWMLMENFQIPKLLGTNEVRRAVFLAVISHTTITVTRNLPESYHHLDFPQITACFDLYRNTMILSSILAIYLTMLPSASHAYSSYVIVLIGDALASLRAAAFGIDSTHLHTHGMAFAGAYYLGSLLSTSDMTVDTEVNHVVSKDGIQA